MDVDCTDNQVPEPVRPFVDITIVLTNDCNARCDFCCNPSREKTVFNVGKFKEFFNEAIGKIEVNKVTITGGETSYCQNNVQKCLEIVNGHCNLMTVNTNGRDMKFLDVLCDAYPLRISMSRHHYLDERNEKIFGTKTISNFKEFRNKKCVVFSCNLIKNEIDCEEEIIKYLEFASKNDIEECSFVGLMPVNDFCKEKMVYPKDLKFDDRVQEYRTLNHPTCKCWCRNYAYVSTLGKVVLFYTRHLIDYKCDKGSRVVWVGDNIL
jgi:molybdenum cofactor biosynthesis enzyme MoaA